MDGKMKNIIVTKEITPAGRELINIDIGTGRVHSFSILDATHLASEIEIACRPSTLALDVCHESPSRAHVWQEDGIYYSCLYCGKRK